MHFLVRTRGDQLADGGPETVTEAVEGQDEVGEVLEHPVVLEGVVDDSQEFARLDDVCLPCLCRAGIQDNRTSSCMGTMPLEIMA